MTGFHTRSTVSEMHIVPLKISAIYNCWSPINRTYIRQRLHIDGTSNVSIVDGASSFLLVSLKIPSSE